MEAEEATASPRPQGQAAPSHPETATAPLAPGAVPWRSGQGVVIDSYQLLELIGEGGMGEVWLAEQKEPVRRRVAIKLIKAGMDTREVIARFESERQGVVFIG